jgi:hypothetical protein
LARVVDLACKYGFPQMDSRSTTLAMVKFKT